MKQKKALNNQKESNYLDRVPVIKKEKWEVLEDGIVEITVENKGFYNTLAQKVFHKPRFSFIKLDEYGSCVWKQIDGEKNLHEIGEALAREHKGAKKQLYERLATFFGVLERNGYIGWKDGTV